MRMVIQEEIISRAMDSKAIKFIESVRYGWNNYSFIFYIGGISAILGSLFGIAGWASIVVTVLFFYYAGRFKKHLDEMSARRKRTKARGQR